MNIKVGAVFLTQGGFIAIITKVDELCIQGYITGVPETYLRTWTLNGAHTFSVYNLIKELRCET